MGVDDRELLARASGGDGSAYGSLYDRHFRSVYRHAYAVLGNPDDAREITQDTFMAGWTKVRDIQLVGESFLPWLSATVWNMAQNRLRSARRSPFVLGLEDDLHTMTGTVTMEAVVEARHLVERIEQEVATMCELDQHIYRLCVKDGFSYDDAAAELGVGNTSIRNRLSRLRSRLRARFGGER